MNRTQQYLQVKLDERTVAGNMRRLKTTRAPIDFFSNDYLGLVTTGALASLMAEQGEQPYTTGSTGSRLLSGNNELAEKVEQQIASFHHTEAAILFNSGYDASIGLLASVAGRESALLMDELCHASIIDGARLSLAKRYKFRHNDIADLEEKLQKHAGTGPTIVVVESVYSMDGDMAPLAEIVALCEQYDAQLVVDEAHATGVVGEHGEGAVQALGLEQRVFARVHTFGKALGCHGAAIVGSSLLKHYLVNFARSFIYTTALPGHSLHAISCAYSYLDDPSFANHNLHQLIRHFRKHVADGSGTWTGSTSPIQALIVGDNEQCRQIAIRVQAAGMQVNAIMHPTVPAGKERLRICLHAFNTEEQVDNLFKIIHSV